MADERLDPHRLAASQIFNVPYGEVTDAQRHDAKNITFMARYSNRDAIAQLLNAAALRERAEYRRRRRRAIKIFITLLLITAAVWLLVSYYF